MGIRLWFIFQSLNQVKQSFGDGAETFLDNIGTKQYFGIQSFETAEAISKQLGEATVTSTSEQSGSSRSRSDGSSKEGKQSSTYGTSKSATYSELARKLLKPEEILTMPQDLSIIFHNNRPPILAKLVTYYNSPMFRTLLPRRYRTGRSPGLGLRAAIVSTMLLAASVFLAAVATAIPSIRLAQPGVTAPETPPAGVPSQNITGTPYRPVSGVPRGYQPLRPSAPTYGRTGGNVGYVR